MLELSEYKTIKHKKHFDDSMAVAEKQDEKITDFSIVYVN